MSRFPTIVAIAILMLLTKPADAQTDLEIAFIEVTQGIQRGPGGPLGSASLLLGRETVVRVYVNSTLSDIGNVEATLTLAKSFSSEERVFKRSINGPITAGCTSSACDGGEDWDHTLNFCFVNDDDEFDRVEVVLNPPSLGSDRVPETDYDNNWALRSINWHCPTQLSVRYRPIRLGTVFAGTDPDPTLLGYGTGAAFVRAAMPISRLDYIPSSPVAWALGLGDAARTLLVATLEADRLLHVPITEQMYGWLPGAVPSNGRSNGLGAAIGNTELSRYQRTFAHELGHNFGDCPDCDSINGHAMNCMTWHGVDAFNLLGSTEADRIKDRDLGLGGTGCSGRRQLMWGGQLTQNAWVSIAEWEYYIDHPNLEECGDGGGAPEGEQDTTLVVGLWNQDTGGVTLDSVFELGVVPVTPSDPRGTHLLRIWADEIIKDELQFSPGAGYHADGPLRGFCLVSADQGDRLEIIDLSTDVAVAEREKSRAAPSAAFTNLDDGDIVSEGRLIEWAASDADGPTEFRFIVRWTPDVGATRVPLTLIQSGTSTIFRGASLPGSNPEDGAIELFVSDGYNTTRIEAFGLSHFALKPPNVDVLSPRSGATTLGESTLHLSAAAVDAEDGVLSPFIQWTSDRDGILGSGPSLDVEIMSAGRHEICATVTDSDGLVGSTCVTIHQVRRFFNPRDSSLRLNELYIKHAGAEDREFIEILGDPGRSLEDLFVVGVRGGNGVATRVYSLGAGVAIPDDGYFVLGDVDVAELDLPFPPTQVDIPGVSTTFFLLEAFDPAEVLALRNEDLDADDDGVLDVPMEALGIVHDAIAIQGPNPAAARYVGTARGPVDGEIPSGVFRVCQWPAPWSYATSSDDPDDPVDGPTPGRRNRGCCPGDVDGSGEVGFADVLVVLSNWGICPGVCPPDLDGDGIVGFADLLVILSGWADCP